MLRVAVAGAAGRMGRMVIEALAESSTARLAAAFERPGHPAVGSEAGPGIIIGDDARTALLASDVVIDFTSPAASVALAPLAGEQGVAAVIGTTGLDAGDHETLARCAARIPIVLSANFSLGVNLLLGLVSRAARALGPEFDAEIVELHHRAKRDAPSGTALALGGALARGRTVKLAQVQRLSRHGDIGPRPAGEIGLLAVRGGDVVGEHTVHFLGPGERIELSHRAGSRAIFARGAVRAALWVPRQNPRLYSMQDVLGLGDS